MEVQSEEALSHEETMKFQDHEEAVKFQELVVRICEVIEKEEKYTFQDVMRALDAIKENYENKGSNLLKRKSIKEVAMFEGLIG